MVTQINVLFLAFNVMIQYGCGEYLNKLISYFLLQSMYLGRFVDKNSLDTWGTQETITKCY